MISDKQSETFRKAIDMFLEFSKEQKLEVRGTIVLSDPKDSDIIVDQFCFKEKKGDGKVYPH